MKVEPFAVAIRGMVLRGNVHWPEQRPSGCVICSHGLFSSKESPKFIRMADDLARGGLVSLRYDHRGCGSSQGRIEDTTVSGRLEDLAAVLNFARQSLSMGHSLGLMGSSMGGFISLLAAARDDRIAGLCAWATPFLIKDRRNAPQAEEYPLLGDGFYRDLAAHPLSEILPRVRGCLLLHGETDELVPVWHARNNYDLLNEPKDIHLFEGGDHRFTNDRHRSEAMGLTVGWLKKRLGRTAPSGEIRTGKK